MSNINIVAILSTTVLPLDGTYKVLSPLKMKKEMKSFLI